MQKHSYRKVEVCPNNHHAVKIFAKVNDGANKAEQLQIGNLCRKCNWVFLNPDIGIESVSIIDLTVKVGRKTDGRRIITKEDIQRRLGMLSS